MSGRRERMARVAKVASEIETEARARWVEADSLVNAVDRERERALDQAAELATVDLPLAFRSHLTGAGARHLELLAGRKAELVDAAAQRQTELQAAVTKVRSLERLIERLDAEAKDRRDRAAAAELQDLVAVRAATEASS